MRGFYERVERIPSDDAGRGDMLLFWISRACRPTHVGVRISEHEFVHAHVQFGKVIVSSLREDYWHDRLCGAGRYTQWRP